MALCAADLDASFLTTDVPPRVVTGAPMRETEDSSFELLLESRSGVRAILPLGLWAVLTASAIGVANAQRVSDEVRAETRNRLDSLLHTYGPTLKMRLYRDSDDPFRGDRAVYRVGGVVEGVACGA